MLGSSFMPAVLSKEAFLMHGCKDNGPCLTKFLIPPNMADFCLVFGLACGMLVTQLSVENDGRVWCSILKLIFHPVYVVSCYGSVQALVLTACCLLLMYCAVFVHKAFCACWLFWDELAVCCLLFELAGCLLLWCWCCFSSWMVLHIAVQVLKSSSWSCHFLLFLWNVILQCIILLWGWGIFYLVLEDQPSLWVHLCTWTHFCILWNWSYLPKTKTISVSAWMWSYYPRLFLRPITLLLRSTYILPSHSSSSGLHFSTIS